MAKFRMTRINPPPWARQPALDIFSVTVAEFAALQLNRDQMMEVVHAEVDTYLNDPKLVFDGNDEGFPNRDRLTGRYYVGDESYIGHQDPTWIQISVDCRCLERPHPGVDREDDYLGLEVWLKWVPGRRTSFEVFRNTDSSSI